MAQQRAGSGPEPRPPRSERQGAREFSRRWHVSVALKRDPFLPEPLLEGTPILHESAGDLGVLLWKSYRDVILWGETAQQDRPNLFQPGSFSRRDEMIRSSSLSGEVRAAVELLTAALRGPDGKPAEIVYCCRRIAEWARADQRRYTAFAMSIAAAAVAPGDASIAFDAGKHAAARGLYVAAEAWLRRAVGLARRSGDKATYADAWLELGRVYAARAASGPAARITIEIDPTAAPIEEVNRRLEPRISPEIYSGPDYAGRARQSFIIAARAARRQGKRQTAGHAYAGLFHLAFASAHYGIADRYGQRALRLLGKRHPATTDLLHAYSDLMLRHGNDASAAMHILQTVLPNRRTPGERIETLLLLVTAAGRATESEVLQRAWMDALSAIENLGDTPETARYLMRLAENGVQIGEAHRANHAARRALFVASYVGDQRLKEHASAFLAAGQHRAPS